MTASDLRRRPGLRTALPEPGNGWVSHYWATPPWPVAPSMDLVSGRLHWGPPSVGRTSVAEGGGTELQLPTSDELWATIESSSPTDAFWLPPSAQDAGVERLRGQVARRLSVAGLPLVVHQTTCWSGSEDLSTGPSIGPSIDFLADFSADEGGQQLCLLDCTASVMADSLESDLADLAPTLGARAEVWWLLTPLIRGLTTSTIDRVHEGVTGLGLAGVFWFAPVLDASDRRRLYELVSDRVPDPEGLYDELFHGGEPDLWSALEAARTRGIETLTPRPLPKGPLRLRRRRDAAGLLFAIGEVRRRRGASEVEVQELNRAALWLDRNDIDVRSLVDDDHLRLIPELRSSRALLERWASVGSREVLTDEIRA